MNVRVKLSASIICADLADLASEVEELEKARVDMLHFDVMDGHFVPNLGLGPVVIEHLRKLTPLPFEVHLMIESPQRYVERFVEAGGQIVAVHVEALNDFRDLALRIRGMGASPAIALNPDTSVSRVEPFLEEVAQVLVMTVEPGFTGQQLLSDTIVKIKKVKETILDRRLSVQVAADGNVSFENAPLMVSAGAGVLVCGTSSLFSRRVGFCEAVRLLRESFCRVE